MNRSVFAQDPPTAAFHYREWGLLVHLGGWRAIDQTVLMSEAVS